MYNCFEIVDGVLGIFPSRTGCHWLCVCRSDGAVVKMGQDLRDDDFDGLLLNERQKKLCTRYFMRDGLSRCSILRDVLRTRYPKDLRLTGEF